jgi:hypothetical protein
MMDSNAARRYGGLLGRLGLKSRNVLLPIGAFPATNIINTLIRMDGITAPKYHALKILAG